MNYALFLDDIRDPSETNPHDMPWVVARSFEEAKSVIASRGMPGHISFDHDLGADCDDRPYPTGFDFAKWLVEESIEGQLDLRGCHFDCHSANPVGRENILGLLMGYMEFI